MSDKYGKYLSPEDKEDTVFSSDRSQLHRDTVRDDLETSTQRDVIRQQGYLDTCLLYTSPSPRDGATSRMPSSA